MNPTPKPELDRIDSTDPLARALQAAFGDALAAAPKRHSKQTPQCVPMSRFVLVTQHGATLTAAERQHIGGCKFCSDNWKAFLAPEVEAPRPAPVSEPETERAAAFTADETTTVINFGASDETPHIDPAPRPKPPKTPRPTAPTHRGEQREPDEEELLVEGLRCRVPGAIERFYNQYYQTFLRVALRLVGDFHTASDLAHDAIVRAITRAETYRPGVRPRVWFMGVIRGTFLDWSRRQKVRRAINLSAGDADDGNVADFELPAHEPSPHERAEAAEKIGAVQQALMMLDPEQRLLITLRVYEEMSLPDVVEVMRAETGGRVATYAQVSGRLHQAKVRLHELLEEHWPDLFP